MAAPREQQEVDETTDSKHTAQKVIGLLNQAQLEQRQRKMDCLYQVKELIISKDPDMLDSFLDEVIAFQQDTYPEVRKFVVQFMEDACKADVGLLVRVIPMLTYMMGDTNGGVIKKVMSALMQLYIMSFKFVVKSKCSSGDLKEMWKTLWESKIRAIDMLESDNDGIRTMAIKYIEIVIIAQTPTEQRSESCKRVEGDVSLDTIPACHEVLDPVDLQEEAGRFIGSLLSLTASPALSSVSLMACISSLTSIARQRPSNMSMVIQTFELLHANLPPHFATSQVTSVRKQLKMQVLSLLRHPSSVDIKEQITTLLTDLGCSQAEILKNSPKPESLKRRRGESDAGVIGKKAKVQLQETESVTEIEDNEEKSYTMAAFSNIEVIEKTAADLKPLLTPEAVTDLVLVSIQNLPRKMPKTFRNSYTPIAAAGTEAQVSHLSRLLSSQITGNRTKNIQTSSKAIDISHDASPGHCTRVVHDPRSKAGSEVKLIGEYPQESVADETSMEDLAESMTELAFLGSLLGMPSIFDPMFPATYASFFGSYPSWTAVGMEPREVKSSSEDQKEIADTNMSSLSSNLVAIPTLHSEGPKVHSKMDQKLNIIPTPQKLKRIRVFDLCDTVKEIEEEQISTLTSETFKRILKAESITAQQGLTQKRISVVIHLVCQYGGQYANLLLDFILDDLRTNFDLALAWLYAEYNLSNQNIGQAYDVYLTRLINGAHEKLDPRDRLFTRLVLEAPKITPTVMDIIKSYCCSEERAFLGVATLKELILRRPHGPEGTGTFLQALLEITLSNFELARVQALHVAKKCYAKPELSTTIERFALQSLQYLLADFPPFQDGTGDMEVASEWTEESVNLCLQLFLSLLPLKHDLLKDLAIVYTSATSVVKRIVLKHIDKPVQAIGMESPQLLQLVESCPVGGETLIMRMLYILTENCPPSAGLVGRVRELYKSNPSDVRFLIPVLHGLQKNEVLTALPQFIKLNPNLVKGVFDRLLLSFKGDRGHSVSPVTPSELLIALHKIDCSNDESLMKATIKATNICFSEKGIYTQEVLAVALQQLLDHSPVPLLYMRTVIQSLAAHPKLVNFVMTILNKLINKQVWKMPTVWQGFVRVCELTKPHSFPIILQLPEKTLLDLIESKSGLEKELLEHIKLFPYIKSTLSPSVLRKLGLQEGEVDNIKKKRKDSSSKRRRLSSKSSAQEKETS